MVTTGGRYKQIGRNQRSHQTKLDTPHMMKVWNVSDIRRCTVRGAAELLIDAGWATLMRHGFLDKVPKDRWLGLVCEALGIDLLPLLKNAKIEADKSLANPPRQ
jgi:hypothetical protein